MMEATTTGAPTESLLEMSSPSSPTIHHPKTPKVRSTAEISDDREALHYRATVEPPPKSPSRHWIDPDLVDLVIPEPSSTTSA
ncbi:hypothetical protein M6B38_257510 [Iris pallida]|uniref:Uncharacterized protein n=1 Tax=Iris pallida TaxID=29817 RepID=A0AAX6G0P5_IRIPA|nr:hypothetical protein M6B38_390300 [Iris pallida]KAJ6852138.1 hypothetical protein M6B38_257510 [Iris pallida]